MISNTELIILGIIIPYTMVIIIGLNRYESRIKDLKGSMEDYKRAHNLSKDVKQHYTQMQLENMNLRNVVSDLDKANKLLQEQIKQLKVALVEPPLQYESSKYQKMFESQVDFE